MDSITLKAELELMRKELQLKQKQLDRHNRRKKALDKLKRKSSSVDVSDNKNSQQMFSSWERNMSHAVRFPLPPAKVLCRLYPNFDEDKTVAAFVSECNFLNNSSTVTPVEIVENLTASNQRVTAGSSDPVIQQMELQISNENGSNGLQLVAKLNKEPTDGAIEKHSTSQIFPGKLQATASGTTRPVSRSKLSRKSHGGAHGLNSDVRGTINSLNICTPANGSKSDDCIGTPISQDTVGSCKQLVQPSPILSSKQKTNYKKSSRLSLSKKRHDSDFASPNKKLPGSVQSTTNTRPTEDLTTHIFTLPIEMHSTNYTSPKQTIDDKPASLPLSKHQNCTTSTTDPSTAASETSRHTNTPCESFETNTTLGQPSTVVTSQPTDLVASASKESSLLTTRKSSQISLISPILSRKRRTKLSLVSKRTSKVNLSKKLARCTISRSEIVTAPVPTLPQTDVNGDNNRAKSNVFNLILRQTDLQKSQNTMSRPTVDPSTNPSCNFRNKSLETVVAQEPGIEMESTTATEIFQNIVPETKRKENVQENEDLEDDKVGTNLCEVETEVDIPACPIQRNVTHTPTASLLTNEVCLISSGVTAPLVDPSPKSLPSVTVIKHKSSLELEKECGTVLEACYNSGYLTVVQESAISFWQQDSSSTVKDSWSKLSSTPRRTINEASLIGRRVLWSLLERKLSEECAVWVELWERCHNKINGMAAIYLLTAEHIIEQCFVDLGHLERNPNDTALFTVANHCSLVISATGTKATIKRYLLSEKRNDVESTLEFVSVADCLSSLQQVAVSVPTSKGRSNVLAGCGNEKLFLWLMEDGRLLRWFPLRSPESDTVGQCRSEAKLWKCYEEKGYLFLLLQVKDSEMELSVTNLTNKRSKRLRSYRVPEEFKGICQVACGYGQVVATFTSGYVAWNLFSAAPSAREISGSLFVSDDIVIVVEDYRATVIDLSES